MKQIPRRPTPSVKIGCLVIGSKHPVLVQSMTDTPTANVALTLRQIKDLVLAGAEMVRITVNDEKAAQGAADIIQALRNGGDTTPIIGDFHFNGHRLLARFPRMAKLLDKYRINPGNIGSGRLHDENFTAFIRLARDYDKPVRIGVNSGSLNQDVLATSLRRNARLNKPKDAKEIIGQAMVESALSSAAYALKLGMPKDKIVLSVKMSDVQEMVAAYEQLARRCDFTLHLGLTEAGSSTEGIVATSAALAILLQKGIGDTIRVSLTPQPGTKRAREVEVCRTLLQALGLRNFSPRIISCPGCGRTDRKQFQTLAQEVKDYIQNNMAGWQRLYPGIERLKVAVMGCVVNGPGESKHADIGISLPGQAEKAAAVVYADGKKIATLKGKRLKDQFVASLNSYIKKSFRKPRT